MNDDRLDKRESSKTKKYWVPYALVAVVLIGLLVLALHLKNSGYQRYVLLGMVILIFFIALPALIVRFGQKAMKVNMVKYQSKAEELDIPNSLCNFYINANKATFKGHKGLMSFYSDRIIFSPVRHNLTPDNRRPVQTFMVGDITNFTAGVQGTNTVPIATGRSVAVVTYNNPATMLSFESNKKRYSFVGGSVSLDKLNAAASRLGLI
jgi:hypothetical protein